MKFLLDNWFIFAGIIAVVVACGAGICRFLKLPRAEQIEAVREWLVMAVTEAERELGSGTGKLKLRFVYDRFVVRFPWVAKAMPFDAFAELVDDALVEMHEMLEQNVAVKCYVGGAVNA